MLAAMLCGIAVVLIALVVAVVTNTIVGCVVAVVLLIAATLGVIAYANHMISASAERDDIRHREHGTAVADAAIANHKIDASADPPARRVVLLIGRPLSTEEVRAAVEAELPDATWRADALDFFVVGVRGFQFPYESDRQDAYDKIAWGTAETNVRTTTQDLRTEGFNADGQVGSEQIEQSIADALNISLPDTVVIFAQPTDADEPRGAEPGINEDQFLSKRFELPVRIFR